MAVIAILHVVVLAVHVPLGVPLWSDPGDWDQSEPRKTPTGEPSLNGNDNDAEPPLAGRAVRAADVTVQCNGATDDDESPPPAPPHLDA